MKKRRDSPELRLRIDKHNLDEECERQPEDFGAWAERLAEAKNRVAKAKAEMELTEAELQLSIRKNPGLYGFAGKPSEKMVGMKVLTLPEYQVAQNEYIAAKYEQDQCEVAVSGLNHKRPLIQELCFLHNASYFSKPSERPRGVKKRRRDDG